MTPLTFKNFRITQTRENIVVLAECCETGQTAYARFPLAGALVIPSDPVATAMARFSRLPPPIARKEIEEAE